MPGLRFGDGSHPYGAGTQPRLEPPNSLLEIAGHDLGIDSRAAGQRWNAEIDDARRRVRISLDVERGAGTRGVARAVRGPAQLIRIEQPGQIAQDAGLQPLGRDDDARLELALAPMLEADQLTHELGDVGPELGEAGELALAWRTRPLGVHEAGKRFPSGLVEPWQQCQAQALRLALDPLDLVRQAIEEGGLQPLAPISPGHCEHPIRIARGSLP